MSKVMPMRDAIARHVRDGDTVVIEGFTHLICFAAAHEIIRQGRTGLTLARLTPDVIYDQMIAAGCAKKLVFSWAGNPGVGSLHAFRRAVEQGAPPLEIEEYSHFGMVGRFSAGAARLPFWPMRNYMGTDLPVANARIRTRDLPVHGRGTGNRARAQSRCHDHPRAARRRRRQRADLGIDRRAEGSGVRERSRDRRRGGTGGRERGARRPESHARSPA